MSALTSERNTPARFGKGYGFPCAADTIVYAGAIVVLNATGFAKGAVAAVGLKGIGRAAETVDNKGGEDGAVKVPVERGCFSYANAGDITLANVGSPAYAVDDQTVSSSSNTNTRSQVGVIRDVDAQGVWVEF